MAFATTRIVIPEAQTINWTAIMWRIALCFVCHGIWLAIYRLFFSSLSAFPGPKIAAATAWYEFYYDVIKQGRYFYRISEMHEKYGPVIRINPWELSIRDGAFYSTLYVSGSTRRSQIFPRSRAGIGIDGSHAVSEDHDLHRVRRKPLDQFFSRRRVQSYEHDIIEELKLLEDRFFAIRGTRTIINMEHVYAAITGDIIGKISVMTSPSLVSDPAFSPDWHSTLSKFFAQISLYTQFTFLVGWVRYIPRSVLLFLTPGAAGFKSFTDTVVDHIKEAKKCTHDAQLTKQSTRYTLIEHLLASEMPEAEKMTARLTGELIAILAGGTMTTARALSTITYFALADPCIGAQLRESVSQAMKGFPGVTPRLVELERVAYLTACVKEGLRMSHGSMRRIARCAPDVELQYKQWTIPQGTPVGMSAYMMHTDAEVYPEPFKFKPERWLGDHNPLMDRNYVPFSRGSRNCLGMHLAYAEIYLTLAVMFRPGGPKLSLYKTDESDVIPVHDFFLAVPKLDSKGLRVTIN